MQVEVREDLLDAAARLRMAVVPLARQLHRHLSEGFTPTQLSVLSTINRVGPLRLGDLAKQERLSLPRISNVVAGLEEAGLVQRLGDADDRRVSLVRTSDTGRAWIQQSRVERDAWLATRLADLTPIELAALDVAVCLLERLIEAE